MNDHNPVVVVLDDVVSETSVGSSSPLGSSSSPWQSVSSNKRKSARKKKSDRGEVLTTCRSLETAATAPSIDSHNVPSIRTPFHTDNNNNIPGNSMMLILVGLPGSFKTTFATSLRKASPRYYIHIQQDVLGSREACVSHTRQALQHGRPCCPVIDRCNVSRAQRRVFCNVATVSTTNHLDTSNNEEEEDVPVQVPVDCIIFDRGVEECIQTVRQRRGHATLHPNQAKHVVERMLSDYQEPNASREGYRHLYRVSDNETFQRVLQLFLNRVQG